jgi:hypothetical protein
VQDTDQYQEAICRTETPPTSTLGKLWAIGDGRAAGCDNRGPWWTNLFVSILATAPSAYAAEALRPGWHPVVYGVVWFTAALLLHQAVTLIDPCRWHGTCEICGQCSAGAGIKSARTRKKCNRNLEDAGWVINDAGDREHCRYHREFGFR